MFCNWDGALAKKSAKSAFTAGLVCLGLLLASTGLVHGKGPVPGAVSDTIALTQLPAQGQDMMKKIYAGGPFKYDKDGTVFGNREKILPAKNRGFYREYTVKTPSERTRGARRIVCGGLQPAAPEACYYTDDHYASFRKIAQ
ncbi:MAG: ribonuclease [Vitreoscilla sp.]|nr:ribonuclease [Polaromonas sp.]